MRGGFLRGIVAGSIIAAAMSMVTGAKQKKERQSILGYGSHQARSKARQMMRSVRKSVNEIIK